MELSTLLTIGKATFNFLDGKKKVKNIDKIYEEQKKVADKYRMYNKEQLYNAYTINYKNMMSNYAIERSNLSEEVETQKSKINILASQNGINLADSSIKDDMQKTLDLEYERNLQNLLTSTINLGAELTSGMVNQDMKIEAQYNSQIQTMGQTVDYLKNKVESDLIEDVAEAGVSLYKGMRNFKSRNPNKNLGKYFLEFDFGGNN